MVYGIQPTLAKTTIHLRGDGVAQITVHDLPVKAIELLKLGNLSRRDGNLHLVGLVGVPVVPVLDVLQLGHHLAVLVACHNVVGAVAIVAYASCCLADQ